MKSNECNVLRLLYESFSELLLDSLRFVMFLMIWTQMNRVHSLKYEYYTKSLLENKGKFFIAKSQRSHIDLYPLTIILTYSWSALKSN